MQAKEPEGGDGLLGQMPAGPGEHGADRGVVVVARGQQVEPPGFVAELGHQPGEGGARSPGGQFGGDPQRQWQPGAPVGQGDGGLRFGVHPGPDQPAEQLDGFRFGQQVEVDPHGAVPGHQCGQRLPAGDQHQAGRRARQQIADLVHGVGVVQ